jgi:hypothetical protein
MALQDPTVFANGLVEEWRPGFYEAANEERVVTDMFTDATEGSVKLKKKIHVRIIPAASVQTAAPTNGTGGTYNSTSPSDKTAEPIFYYSGIEWRYDTLTRLQNESASARAAWKNQLLKALATKVDTVGAAEAANLLQIVGGAQNNDKALMLDALQTLNVSAKDEFKPGKTMGHFRIINTQFKASLTIQDVSDASIRGDNSSGVTKGWLSKLWNCSFQDSGNVYTSGGIAFNMLYLPLCKFLAFNQTAMLLPPQPDELLIREIAIQEFGVGEAFDDYGVVMKTNS